VVAYCFEEVFAEKLRALAERQRPRDLYDVVNLYRRAVDINRASIRATLAAKCEFRGIPIPTVGIDDRRSTWDIMQL
jgi:predicted nucleotidyltransferase component of viral defense system